MDNFPCLWRGRRYLLRFIVMDVGLDSFELRDLCNQRSGAGDLMSRMSLSEGYQQVDFIRLIRLPLGVQRLLVWVRWRQAVVHEWVFTPMKSSFVVHRRLPQVWILIWRGRTMDLWYFYTVWQPYQHAVDAEVLLPCVSHLANVKQSSIEV